MWPFVSASLLKWYPRNIYGRRFGLAPCKIIFLNSQCQHSSDSKVFCIGNPFFKETFEFRRMVSPGEMVSHSSETSSSNGTPGCLFSGSRSALHVLCRLSREKCPGACHIMISHLTTPVFAFVLLIFNCVIQAQRYIGTGPYKITNRYTRALVWAIIGNRRTTDTSDNFWRIFSYLGCIFKCRCLAWKDLNVSSSLAHNRSQRKNVNKNNQP